MYFITSHKTIAINDRRFYFKLIDKAISVMDTARRNDIDFDHLASNWINLAHDFATSRDIQLPAPPKNEYERENIRITRELFNTFYLATGMPAKSLDTKPGR